MRVLLIPELYRPDHATANGTLNDAVVWVDRWLTIDETVHVYWLLPPPDVAEYDPEYVHADHDRVTVVEARPFMSGEEFEFAFTETGYTEDQLWALKEAIFDRHGYVDVVVDQLRRGRADLYKWLLLCSGRKPDEPAPFSVIVNVHDLLLPFKYRESRHRNDFQRRMEVAGAAFADGMWFKAGVDADGMREFGSQFLQPAALEPALDRAVVTHSPIDFSRFDEVYSDRPEWLHVAGSIWQKKQTDVVMDVAATLNERFGIRTLITSMSEVPERFSELPWVEAHSNTSRETYEAALRRGDLAICASEYETLARTWFEQAASGQVLLLRHEPWIYDCVPADYRLVGNVDELEDLAVRAVTHWPEAVAENRRMVEYVRHVRDPERAGRETYADLRRHVERTARNYSRPENRAVVERALADLDGEISLTELDRCVTAIVDEREPLSVPDLVFALRSLGYEDTGNPGTPVFRRDDSR